MAATKTKLFTNLAQRIDYSKNDLDFYQEPDLLFNTKNSYDEKKFLAELEEIFEIYYPIKYEKAIRRENDVFYNVNFVQIMPLEKSKDYVTEDEARQNGLTFAKDLYVKLSLENTSTGEIEDTDEIFFGKVPQLTKRSTFIINGVEKNITSQLIRSPGIYHFDRSKSKIFSKKSYLENVLEVLPGKGSMINLFIHNGNLKFVIANVARKSVKVFTFTQVLKALGLSETTIKEIFNENPIIVSSLKSSDTKSANKDISESDVFTRENVAKNHFLRNLIGKDPKTQGINSVLTELINSYDALPKKDSKEAIGILDKLVTEMSAKYIIDEIGIPIKSIVEKKFSTSYFNIFYGHLCNPKVYNLFKCGRYKINNRLSPISLLKDAQLYEKVEGLDIKANEVLNHSDLIKINNILSGSNNVAKETYDLVFKDKTIKDKAAKPNYSYRKLDVILNGQLEHVIFNDNQSSLALTISDLLSMASFALIELPKGKYGYDEIEHLSNKRVRQVNELLCEFLIKGIADMEKSILEKLAVLTSPTANDENKKRMKDKATVRQVVNTNHFSNRLNTFFNTYELTNFLDQVNPISELSAKRKITATGEGGLSKEGKSIDVRDIQNSQYGRICPIEAPEGKGVGLVHALATYSTIDENGFITTPLRIVKNGVITDEVVYLSAIEADQHIICTSDAPHDKNGKILADKLVCRFNQTSSSFLVDQVEYAEVSARQVLSCSASLIPFLECNEAHRGEMAANMQRQAIPLIVGHAPAVGTGFEAKAARDSMLCVIAEDAGVVNYVDATKIRIGDKTYELEKFYKTNQSTCLNQTPLVHVGQHVKAGDIIADSSGIRNGEIALGENLKVAFMCWNGYNFEDGIVISKRLLKNELLTSTTMKVIECKVFSTPYGDEVITRDIPTADLKDKMNLDEEGIVQEGTYVRAGDILIGKQAPQAAGYEELSAEDAFLQKIFGEKTNSKYKNVSIRVGSGDEGIVYKILRLKPTPQESDKDVIDVIKIYIAQKRYIQVGDKLAGRHGNKGVIAAIVDEADMPHLADGTPIDICLNPAGVPSRMNLGQIMETHFGLALWEQAYQILFDCGKTKDAKTIQTVFGIDEVKAKVLAEKANEYIKNNKVTKLDNLSVNIILTQAGLLFQDLNNKIASPSFEGAKIEDLKDFFKEVGIDLSKNGKEVLYDGISGEKFDNEVMVGTTYMLKLDHMIEDKLRARNTGSYSRITQQPLGGGGPGDGGQRVGEMEVWAYEAYGAAYNLRELMTIKSDDIVGRKIATANIIHNIDKPMRYNLPETFKYTTKLLQALCVKIEVETDDGIVDMNDLTTSEFAKTTNEKVLDTKESVYGLEEGGGE